MAKSKDTDTTVGNGGETHQQAAKGATTTKRA